MLAGTPTAGFCSTVRAKLAELDRDTTEVGTHRRRENTQQLLNELHNSLTEAERAKLKAVESQLYDDAGLPR
jgi:non-homologous end joining protein Ku